MLKLCHVSESEELKLEVYYHAETDMLHFFGYDRRDGYRGACNAFVTSYPTLLAIVSGGAYVRASSPAELHEAIAMYRQAEDELLTAFAPFHGQHVLKALSKIVRNLYRHREEHPSRASRLNDNELNEQRAERRAAGVEPAKFDRPFGPFGGAYEYEEVNPDAARLVRQYGIPLELAKLIASDFGDVFDLARTQENGAARHDDAAPAAEPAAPQPAAAPAKPARPRKRPARRR